MDDSSAAGSAAQYGFKLVTAQNLADPDPLVSLLVTREGETFRRMTPEDFARPILAVTLEEPVPFEVRHAFLYARNAMCYGYWYWPVVTLGFEQVLRVADFATNVAARANGLKPKWSFERRIDQLIAATIIETERKPVWNYIRKLRNKVTHPERQLTWGIAQPITDMRLIAEAIQGLRWVATPETDKT